MHDPACAMYDYILAHNVCQQLGQLKTAKTENWNWKIEIEKLKLAKRHISYIYVCD